MSWGKRLFDLFWASVGLVVLSPLLLVISAAIMLQDGGTPFFLQERVGYRGRSFRMWKFRTMVVDAEQCGGPLTIGQDRRVTPIGRWLRHTKLDELPQLINVLRGEMSLVGPRPEVPSFVALYTPQQRQVLELVPGITDPASIRYRNESQLLAASPEPERLYVEEVMPAKISSNLEYASKAGVLSDVEVILRTLGSLVSG